MINKNQMKETANQFYLAASSLISEDNVDKFIQLTSPYIILLALSIELYFKYIIYSTNSKLEKGHNLRDLYNKIDSNIKNIIKIDDIETILDKNSDAFVDWRYYYENDNNEFDITKMKMIADSLYKYCNN